MFTSKSWNQEMPGALRAVVARSRDARQRLSTFCEDTAGDIAMMFGLMSLAMFFMIGAAVDLGRWLNAKQTTQVAIDAAVLAGGRSLQTSNDWNAAIAVAEQYYRENTRNRIKLESDEIQFVVVDDGLGFTSTGSAYISTPFMQLAGVDRLPVFSLSAAEHSKAQLAVGGNAKKSVEISVMLDVSGSMAGQKALDMKNAAKDLVDIVVWDDQSQYTSKVAVVPFSTQVRLPNYLLTAARDPAMSANVYGPTHSCRVSGKWRNNCRKGFRRRDCVVERKGNDRYTDAGPGSGRYVMPLFGRNSSITTGYSGNVNCAVGASSAVMPLSNNKTALKNMIDGLAITGMTAGHLGTAWAWYMISPEWASVLPEASRPQPYDTADLQKIAILMTDGEYNQQFTIHGVSTGESQRPTPNGAANASSNVQARALCDGMKAKGITVYTVGFALGGNSTAINTMNYCATTPGHAYLAENGEGLRQAFRDIALKISTLYISK